MSPMAVRITLLPRPQQLVWRWQELIELEQPGQPALHAFQLLAFMAEQGGTPQLGPGALLRRVEERRAA